jgi:acetyl esterase/lipase
MPSRNIYVGGDSAGAHLAIAFLASISQPHPAASPINLLGKKLAGAFLICPWVTFNPKHTINDRECR